MIALNDIHLSYGPVAVFEGISIQIEPGFMYGILGKNGSGKSTLLYSMVGLLRPKKGKMNVLGYPEPWNKTPAFLQQVFLVPEEFYLPDISIKDLLKFHSVFYPRFDQQQFHSYLDTFEVPDHTLLKMSYGQKKKVLISFGLASNASLLLMDEPTNGLDIISKKQLRKVLSGALSRENNIIISSHQVHDLTNLIDNVIILDDPRFVMQRSLKQIGEKLSFIVSNDEYRVEEAIFSEPSRLGGNSYCRIKPKRKAVSILSYSIKR